MSRENLEPEIVARVERFYAAYNRRDWDAWFAEVDPEIEWDPVEEGEVYSGREVLIGVAENWLSTFEHFEWAPEEIELSDAQGVMFVAARSVAKSKGSRAPIEGHFFHVALLREGRFWRVREFTDRDEAVAAFRGAAELEQ